MEPSKDWETLLRESLGPGARGSASELALLDDPRSIPALLGALASPERWVRRRAGEALVAFRERGRLALTESVGDARPAVRREAVRALGESGPTAFEAVLETRSDPDVTVRRQAVGSLGTIGDPRGLDAIFDASHDPNQDVRHSAAWALYAVGRAAWQRIVAGLHDGDAPVRLMSVEALGYAVNPLMAGLMPSELPVSDLVPLLDDEDRFVRRQAAPVLAYVNPSDDPVPWQLMAASDDPEIRKIAGDARRNRLTTEMYDRLRQRRMRELGPSSMDLRWQPIKT
jgi:HEAT repeat protein